MVSIAKAAPSVLGSTYCIRTVYMYTYCVRVYRAYQAEVGTLRSVNKGAGTHRGPSRKTSVVVPADCS